MKQNNGKNEINLRLNSSSSIILLLFCMFLLFFFRVLVCLKEKRESEKEKKREIRRERRILFYLFSVVLSLDSKLCSIFLIYVESSYYFLLISCVIWYFSELWRLNESWEKNERRDFSFTLFLIYYSFILLSRYFLLYVSDWFFFFFFSLSLSCIIRNEMNFSF